MLDLSGLNAFTTHVAQGSGYVLLDFWGPSCAPCIPLTAMLESIAPEFPTIQFFKVNADVELDIAVQAGVRGLPTLILYKNGREQQRWIGAQSQAKFKAALQQASRG